MRVAHVITRLIVGGAQENTIASVLGLRAKPGVAVNLLSGPTTGPEGSLEPRVAHIPGLLTVVPELIRPVSPWHDWGPVAVGAAKAAKALKLPGRLLDLEPQPGPFGRAETVLASLPNDDLAKATILTLTCPDVPLKTAYIAAPG